MITFMEAFRNELESESEGTRKILALVPADKLDWAPHPKSMKMGDLATHIANLPEWISMGIHTSELDFATSPYNPRVCKSGADLVNYYNECTTKAMTDLSKASDSILADEWVLRNGDIVYVKQSKLETIRHAFCQMVHHRAQLGVYLRLLNIPIPGVYGPSADDQGM